MAAIRRECYTIRVRCYLTPDGEIDETTLTIPAGSDFPSLKQVRASLLVAQDQAIEIYADEEA